ncbi:hypothetical protein RvY_11734 [Ramazzottius varieornatus]|uniref:Uncharacterized protein n=1 Tax=Ramazzottius varieornatus TaxID=947166 RepID=A0A1D1VPU2_RAMVA|nr:hypothetical protein RvY_11734 [Ramazzottius varieornatus]
MTPKKFTVVNDPKPDTVRKRLKRAAEKRLRDAGSVRRQRVKSDLEVIPLEELVDEVVIPANQPALDSTHRHDVGAFSFGVPSGVQLTVKSERYCNPARPHLATQHFSPAWSVSPAKSREGNEDCLPHTSNFYDKHDMWHMLSAFALYFTFMTQMTLDDDLATAPRPIPDF